MTKSFITSALLGAIVLCAIGAAAGGARATTAGTPQTIIVTVHAPTTAPFDTAFSVSANSTSGLAVTFSAGGSCTTAGTGSADRFRMTSGTGTCLVMFDQAGNGTFDPAPQVVESVTAQKVNQSIIFGPLDGATFGEADFDIVGVFSTSGLAVAFTASGNCTVSGVSIHLTGAGSCTITASQPGDANYNPAPQATQTFAIGKSDQQITFNPLGDRVFGDRDFTVRASADSGLAVSFTAAGQCTVRAARVHLTASGKCKITASQAGNVNFDAAPRVSQSFAIARRACFVPRVTGKTLAFAKKLLVKNHCRAGRVTYAGSRTIAKGRVISQGRKPFLTLREFTRINLVVSLGRP